MVLADGAATVDEETADAFEAVGSEIAQTVPPSGILVIDEELGRGSAHSLADPVSIAIVG